MSKALRVCITGAGGQIGYSILQPLANGLAFGPNQPVHLVLLDIKECENVIKGVAMELEDCASPLLDGVTVCSDPAIAFENIDVLICLAGLCAIKEGGTRFDLIETNKGLYTEHGKMLDKHANKTVKIVVVANPCNSLCLLLMNNAPSIPKENFSCLTRLDHNRTIAMLAYKAGVHCNQIENVIVWGNHSSTMVPDVTHARLNSGNKLTPIKEVIKDNKFWNSFEDEIRDRFMKVLNLRKRTSALSSAWATVCHLRDWFLGTPPDQYVSMGVLSDGSHDVPSGIFFSFPCACKDGKYHIINSISVDNNIKEKMEESASELLNERKAVL